MLAVGLALLGWLVAYLLYGIDNGLTARLARVFPGPHKLLANKYFVDEIYGVDCCQAAAWHSRSTFWAGLWMWAFWAELAWLLGGMAMLTGAILQRWQSGNLRSYAAWLAAGAAAVLLFLLVPWTTVWPVFDGD